MLTKVLNSKTNINEESEDYYSSCSNDEDEKELHKKEVFDAVRNVNI